MMVKYVKPIFNPAYVVGLAVESVYRTNLHFLIIYIFA